MRVQGDEREPRWEGRRVEALTGSTVRSQWRRTGGLVYLFPLSAILTSRALSIFDLPLSISYYLAVLLTTLP
ncbi:hypothetical protein E2C01_032337 [Portunus trituberculatus]|uniref:Uncharacterized protein n=1 Tax=Portunus trituberculatus TaxID=210409 RepID=A0A5B7EVR7_PORTR|nr:hypothetical protein [Portunus trituberculatus]